MEPGPSELEDLRGREKQMGGSKHHEVDNSAHPSWAGCQENGAAPGSGGHGCTQPTLQKPPQAPSLETGGSHTPLSRQALREGGWALWARTGPGRRCRWSPAGWGQVGSSRTGGRKGGPVPPRPGSGRGAGRNPEKCCGVEHGERLSFSRLFL